MIEDVGKQLEGIVRFGKHQFDKTEGCGITDGLFDFVLHMSKEYDTYLRNKEDLVSFIDF